ncbi:MAG TPA: NFACT family protein, partial [Spirochaetia bacterium]|nr:NFACT family protein [Spirochaetia bacterium]
MTASLPPSLNWREIDLVLSELSLPGSLIQEINQPAHDRFILDLFRKGERISVLVSLSSRLPRLHAITAKPANPQKPPRFASFLRAHLRGGRIESVEHRDRIVRITVSRSGEQTLLWIRLWGSAANAILTDAGGTILDAFYRRPKKNEVSGKTFASEPGKTAAKEYSIRELPGDGTFNGKLEKLFQEQETA